jgi:hypothetical protein
MLSLGKDRGAEFWNLILCVLKSNLKEKVLREIESALFREKESEWHYFVVRVQDLACSSFWKKIMEPELQISNINNAIYT